MAERLDKYIIYSADDEMPDCMKCEHIGGGFNCEKSCGAEHGWYGYTRVVDTSAQKE